MPPRDPVIGTIDGEPVTLKEAAAKAGVRTCLLCGGKPDYTGLFIPSDEKRDDFVGAMVLRGMCVPEKGKVRLGLYALCQDCFERPDRDAAIDRIIFAPVEG